MSPLQLSLKIPLAGGHIAFAADIPDLDALDPKQREVLAETAREFARFAADSIAHTAVVTDLKAAATVHDPSADVLRGVTGSRRNTS